MARTSTARARPGGLPPGLRYETHEVRHLLRLQDWAMSLQLNADAVPRRGRRGVVTTTMGLRTSAIGQFYARVHPDTLPDSTSESTAQANRILAELYTELQKYRRAIEGATDRQCRLEHARMLTQLLVEHEDRSRALFAAGLAPPLHVIVTTATMEGAGLQTQELRVGCDRALPWRVWRAAAWNHHALRANQAACNRDVNRIITGVDVPAPWLVRQPAELARLSAFMGDSTH